MRVHALHQSPTVIQCASTSCARRGPRVRRAARWQGRGIRAVDRQPAHGNSEGQNGRAECRCSVRARQATWRSRPRTSRAPLARLGIRRAQDRRRSPRRHERGIGGGPRRAKRKVCVFRRRRNFSGLRKDRKLRILRFSSSFFDDDESADCDSSCRPGGGTADFLRCYSSSYVCHGVQCSSRCASDR